MLRSFCFVYFSQIGLCGWLTCNYCTPWVFVGNNLPINRVYMYEWIIKTVATVVTVLIHWLSSPIARFIGPTWGQSGADRTQVGPMLAPWTLLSGIVGQFHTKISSLQPTALQFEITFWKNKSFMDFSALHFAMYAALNDKKKIFETNFIFPKCFCYLLIQWSEHLLANHRCTIIYLYMNIYIHYRPKVWNILKPNGNSRTWHFDLLEMAWHQPQLSIVTLMHFSCIVLGVKNTTCNVRN